MTRVLLVEDDEDMRVSLTDVLEDAGHEVCAVGSGARALEVAPEFLPELVLTDLHMPKMSGQELAERLSAQLSETTLFVAVTGDVQVLKRLPPPFVDGLLKPFRIDELLRAVDRKGDGQW